MAGLPDSLGMSVTREGWNTGAPTNGGFAAHIAVNHARTLQNFLLHLKEIDLLSDFLD